jgi:glutamine synthetase
MRTHKRSNNMTPKEVIAFAKENNVKMVDYKFLDFVGIWQHFTTPISEFERRNLRRWTRF